MQHGWKDCVSTLECTGNYNATCMVLFLHTHNTTRIKNILNHKKVKEYLDKNDLESAVLTLFSI